MLKLVGFFSSIILLIIPEWKTYTFFGFCCCKAKSSVCWTSSLGFISLFYGHTNNVSDGVSCGGAWTKQMRHVFRVVVDISRCNKSQNRRMFTFGPRILNIGKYECDNINDTRCVRLNGFSYDACALSTSRYWIFRINWKSIGYGNSFILLTRYKWPCAVHTHTFIHTPTSRRI